VADALPKVTPYLLRQARSMCARRLAKEVEGGDRSHEPMHRARLRDAFLAAARDAHAECRVPEARHFAGIGAALEPEERRVLEQAAHWYLQVFGDRAARYVEHGLDTASVSGQRHLRIGGWVDLAVEDADGAKELRAFDLWAGRAPAHDPLELDALKVAVLRLSRWVGDEPLRVVWVDLVRGPVRERVVDVAAELPGLRDWFDARVEVVRERTADPVAEMGADCGTCKFVAACPEHPRGAHFGRRSDFLPGILTLTPTALDTWRRCPREWRNAHVLQVPASDGDSGGVHGQQVHDLLRMVHEHGSCRDAAHVDDVLAGHGFDGDERVHGEVERHVRRCPEHAGAVGHEITRARFFRDSRAPFMATARIDALWAYDDVLDAHDYKTGRVWSDRVADDAQARLQAWVLAPLADARGARLRITFEHLAADVLDDPEPFEPDADDLAAIGEELHAITLAMRSRTEATGSANWAGVAEAEICGRCRYRSICPDSAVEAVPVWPRVDDEDELDVRVSP
jgi:hypothetical protein